MNQQELFKLFCGTNEIRPVMLLPFEWNGKIAATDAHKLIRCNKICAEFEIDNPHKALNIDAITPKINCNRIIANKLEDFEAFKTVDELVKEGRDIKCAECDGDGEVEWEYKEHTKEDECPECYGSGYSYVGKLIPSGKKTFGDESYLTMDDALFDVNVFITLFEAQKMIGKDIISLNKVEKNKPAFFKIGIYEIIIMPIHRHGDEKTILDISFKPDSDEIPTAQN